eukprot:GCRY01005918.1.p1 GENE.GCRY01005918.1~~GCRY01005918.1.p1  ORF type:complete len:110 (+),score=27.47 GCRY01005918.1:148-477(+)
MEHTFCSGSMPSARIRLTLPPIPSYPHSPSSHPSHPSCLPFLHPPFPSSPPSPSPSSLSPSSLSLSLLSHMQLCAFFWFLLIVSVFITFFILSRGYSFWISNLFCLCVL